MLVLVIQIHFHHQANNMPDDYSRALSPEGTARAGQGVNEPEAHHSE